MRRTIVTLIIACMLFSGCGVSLTSVQNMESGESIEDMEMKEELESLGEDLDELGIDEIENNWPEYVRYSADGVYADPMITTIEIKQPVKLSLSCVTEEGNLRLKIIDNDSKEVYFDKENPDGDYTVEIDDGGTYQILFYAKYHVGSVIITPAEE